MSSVYIDPTTLKTSPPGLDGIPSLSPGSPTSRGAPARTAPPSTSTTSTTHPVSAKSSATSAPPAATGLRQRVNSLNAQLDANPTVKNAKGTALKQIDGLRQTLGRSPFVVNLEKRTGVDRVALVGGAVLAYLILIPLNLFGLALPTTTLLTLVPASFLALGILEQPATDKTEAATRALLSYFVTLGFVQFAESLAAGFLEKRIPQYYTVKLLFLAYLLHPRTQGAIKLHQSVYRPLLAQAQSPVGASTPAQTGSSSPTFPATSVGSTGSKGTTPTSQLAGSGITPAHSAPTSIDVDGIAVPPGFEHKATIASTTIPSASTLSAGNTFDLPAVPTPGLENQVNQVLQNLSESDPQAAELLKTQAAAASQHL